MTNLGFIKFCEENGIRFVATKVGDRFVLEEMLLEEYDFGGEQSGHVIYRDFATNRRRPADGGAAIVAPAPGRAGSCRR